MNNVIQFPQRRSALQSRPPISDTFQATTDYEHITLEERIERVKTAIIRINALMAELREAAPQSNR